MSTKLLRMFTALLAVGVLILAGCGSGGGGGGGGGDGGGDSGPPAVTGNTYMLTLVNGTTEHLEIIRGTTSNAWLATLLETGDKFWGTYTVLPSGILKLVRTDSTNSEFPGPAVLYAVEVVNGYLFLLNPDDAFGSVGGYSDMAVAFNQQGACGTVTTQANYNLVKTGQTEWDATSHAAFGTVAFTTGTIGVQFSAPMFTLGMDLGYEPSFGIVGADAACTGGGGGLTADRYAFTASGIGLLTHFEDPNDQDFVAMVEPASDVDGDALMGVGKTYAGIWQGMEDVGGGFLDDITYLVAANGTGSGIEMDSFLNPDTGELSGAPATLVLARAGSADRHGLFDNANFSFGGSNGQAVSGAQLVGGKHVLIAIGQFDVNGDETLAPEDWFFSILMEQ